MPLYAYECETCGAELDILHGIDKAHLRCDLSCKLQGEGTFGQGVLRRKITAASISRKVLPDRSFGSPDRKEKMTEGEMSRARDLGMTIYRKDTDGTYRKDGGDKKAPATLKP